MIVLQSLLCCARLVCEDVALYLDHLITRAGVAGESNAVILSLQLLTWPYMGRLMEVHVMYM